LQAELLGERKTSAQDGENSCIQYLIRKMHNMSIMTINAINFGINAINFGICVPDDITFVGSKAEYVLNSNPNETQILLGLVKKLQIAYREMLSTNLFH
jgi:hypothetical protein